jgi:uncharacterized delta-60 repeat protein
MKKSYLNVTSKALSFVLFFFFVSFISNSQPAGLLDLSFDTDGLVKTNIGDVDAANDIVILPSGKIIAAGYSEIKSGIEFSLAKYNTDGSLDESFGIKGTVTIPVTGFDTAHAVTYAVINKDTLIFAGGNAKEDAVIVCLDNKGNLLKTFADNGVLILDLDGSQDIIYDLLTYKIENNMYLYAAAMGGSENQFKIIKIDMTGKLVTDFGNNGINDVKAEGTHVKASAIIEHNNQIVHACATSSPSYAVCYSRYDAVKGEIDNSFGEKGYASIVTKTPTNIFDLALHNTADDTLGYLAVGTNQDQFLLTRVDVVLGKPDPAFGSGGIVIQEFSKSATGEAHSVDIQLDGKVIAAGTVVDKSLQVMGMARFLADGKLDPSFNHTGLVLLTEGTNNLSGNAVMLQEDQRIVLAGYNGVILSGDYDYQLARYLNLVFTAHPEGQSKCVGSDATFSLSLTGCSKKDLEFQWLKSTQPVGGKIESILGATKSKYVIDSVVEADAGYYACAISYKGTPSDTTDFAQLTVLSAPVLNLGNDTSVCTGEIVTLDAENPGYCYEWNTGDSTQTIDVSIAGDYAVTVTDYSTCEASDTINITTLPVPDVDLGNDTAICNGNAVIMDAGNPGSTYYWSTTETSQVIAVTTSNTYSVTVTNGDGCTDTDDKVVTVLPPPSVDLGNDTSICANTSLTLDAENAGYQFNWSTGATTQTIDVNTDGDYAVTVTDGASCEDADTITITTLSVPVVNLGNDTSIADGEYVILDAGNPGASYAWSTSETSKAILVDTTGIYSVTVTDGNACQGSDTIEVTVMVTIDGIIDEKALSINPNPFSDVTEINYTLSNDATVTISVITENGTLVTNLLDEKQQAGNYSLNINSGDIGQSGLYLLQIKANNKLILKKIVLTK